MRILCSQVPTRANQSERDALRDLDGWRPLTVHNRKLQRQIFEHLLSPLASGINHSLSLVGCHVQLQPMLPGQSNPWKQIRSRVADDRQEKSSIYAGGSMWISSDASAEASNCPPWSKIAGNKPFFLSGSTSFL